MATRIERWRKLRQRMLNRRNRQVNEGWKWVLYTNPATGKTYSVKAFRKWMLPTLRMMSRPALNRDSYGHGEIRDLSSLGIFATVTPAGYRKLPRPKLSGLPVDLARLRNWHWRFALHGYQRRVLPVIGRLPGRMNGLRRQVWGCNWKFMKEGCFPDSDPLQRRPNESDINAGVPRVSHPQWPGFPAGT